LIIGFQDTVKNVGDVFWGHSVVAALSASSTYYCIYGEVGKDNKKFEQMLTRRAKAYSSSGSPPSNLWKSFTFPKTRVFRAPDGEDLV